VNVVQKEQDHCALASQEQLEEHVALKKRTHCAEAFLWELATAVHQQEALEQKTALQLSWNSQEMVHEQKPAWMVTSQEMEHEQRLVLIEAQVPETVPKNHHSLESSLTNVK